MIIILFHDTFKFLKKLLIQDLVTRASRDKTLLLSLGVEERDLPTSVIAEQLVYMGKYILMTKLVVKVTVRIQQQSLYAL